MLFACCVQSPAFSYYTREPLQTEAGHFLPVLSEYFQARHMSCWKAHHVLCVMEEAMLRPLAAVGQLIQGVQVGPGNKGSAVYALPNIEAGSMLPVAEVKAVNSARLIRV